MKRTTAWFMTAASTFRPWNRNSRTSPGISIRPARVSRWRPRPWPWATPTVSEEDMAKSLLYVVNRFREDQGGEFTIKRLSTNLSSLMDEAAQSVDAFKRLIADASFDLALQPIVAARSGEIHHYEALARFHSQGRDESPFKQITFAEETGMIADFDLAVVDKAIAWLGQWPRNTSRYRIAVNISGHSVGSDRYVSMLHKRLRENAWVQDRLLFEITESSRMADLEEANTFIQGLRKAGHHVCLDDFGGGSGQLPVSERTGCRCRQVGWQRHPQCPEGAQGPGVPDRACRHCAGAWRSKRSRK